MLSAFAMQLLIINFDILNADSVFKWLVVNLGWFDLNNIKPNLFGPNIDT